MSTVHLAQTSRVVPCAAVVGGRIRPSSRDGTPLTASSLPQPVTHRSVVQRTAFGPHTHLRRPARASRGRRPLARADFEIRHATRS